MEKNILIKNISFSFKGNRSYIQGPDIFNESLKSIGYLNSCSFFQKDFKKINFSIHSFLNKPNANLYKLDNIRHIDKKKIIALFEILTNSLDYYAVIQNPISNEEIVRVDYDETKVTNYCMINNHKISVSKVDYSLMETIVSMNKFLLSSIFNNLKGKWIFTKISLYGEKNFDNFYLEYDSNFKMSLFKTKIFKNNILIGDLYFNFIK